jgi:hypothetical protein
VDHNSFAPLRLCEKKKEKKIWRPAILRGWLQRRKAAKASGKQTGKNPPWQTRGGLQFLCGSAPLREKKRKKIAPRNSAGQAEKSPSRKEGKPIRRGGKSNRMESCKT